MWVEYVLLNFLLFGGIYALSKVIEDVTWYFVENYDEIMEKLDNHLSKSKE